MSKILEVRGLTRIHGRGCPLCIEATGPESDTNICPHCGSVVAAHDVSFDLYRGEILGIIGESGSGKSTVVKTLYFDDAPSAGQAAMRERQKKCGAEWKAAKAAGKIEKGMKWPKFWSAWNKRLKSAG